MELPKIKIELINFIRRYQCDSCKEGEMIFMPDEINGIIYCKGEGIGFKHVCNKCGGEGYLAERYPCLFQEYQ